MATSPIAGRRGSLVITKRGSSCELGAVRAEYKARHPNAMERLLKSPPEIENSFRAVMPSRGPAKRHFEEGVLTGHFTGCEAACTFQTT